MPVPFLAPLMGSQLSPVSEDEDRDLGIKRTRHAEKTVRFVNISESENMRFCSSDRSSSDEGEDAGGDTFSVGSDLDNSSSSESSSEGEQMSYGQNEEGDIRSPYLRTSPRSGKMKMEHVPLRWQSLS